MWLLWQPRKKTQKNVDDKLIGMVIVEIGFVVEVFANFSNFLHTLIPLLQFKKIKTLKSTLFSINKNDRFE
jgi:hypothetical protein